MLFPVRRTSSPSVFQRTGIPLHDSNNPADDERGEQETLGWTFPGGEPLGFELRVIRYSFTQFEICILQFAMRLLL